MLNHIVIMGRLGKDPELRRTQSGVAVATFNVAVDRDFKDKATGQRATDWITCVAWRSTAEFVEKYLTKGSQVFVAGRLQMRNWTDKDGNKRVSAEVQAENVYFAGAKTDGGQRELPGFKAMDDVPEFEVMDDDDPDLPF